MIYRHSDNVSPSIYYDDVWLWAQAPEGKIRNERGIPKSGKWMVWISKANVDKTWQKIKDSVEKGELGIGAKVATAAQSDKVHLICIYTYDHTDEGDVRRVRDKLRELGFTSKMPYKTDEATLSGKYGKGTSKYYC